MPHVLHLRGPTPADGQTDRLHAVLVDRLGTEFPGQTVTIGPGRDCRTSVGAAGVVRRGRPDVLVAWGTVALAAAALAGRVGRTVFVPEGPLSGAGVRWARVLLDRTGGHAVCASDAQRRDAVRRGVPPDRCHVIRPGVDFARARRSPDVRRTLRAELGFADDDTVLLAPGESTRAADHERAVWTCGILHILDPRYKIVLQGRGDRAPAAVRLAGKLKQSGMIAAAEPALRRRVTTEELMSVADACLLSPAGVVPTLPVLTAMAAGVPTVATVTYQLSELLEDRHTALMVPTNAPKQLARRVMDLRADPSLAARVADAARAEAYQLHTQSRMVERFRRVLRQVGQGRAVDPEGE